MDILADTVVNWLIRFWSIFLWPLIQFLIGLGVVVFVHELGHYLCARWAGIKVERFALGFGPRVVGFKKGETDYCLCAIPIGGYVKMLGQEDFKPLDEDDTIDPHSFHAASVGKRLVVISAGVVMNIILSAVLFIIICMIGMKFNAPVVGGTAENSPASKTKIDWSVQPDATAPKESIGLKPGDRFLTIDGKKVSRFSDIGITASLASKNEEFDVTLARDVDGRTWIGKTSLIAKYNKQLGIPQFGISPAQTLVVANPEEELITDSLFRPGDRVVAINERKIEHPWQIPAIEKDLDGKPCKVTVQRGQQKLTFEQQPDVLNRSDVYYKTDGTRIEGRMVVDRQGPKEKDIELTDSNGETVSIKKYQVAFRTDGGAILVFSRSEIAGGGNWNLLDVLGMTPRLEIMAIVKGSLFSSSPAEAADLRPGDIILSYADRPSPTWRKFKEISQQVGQQKTRLIVLRDGKVLTKEIRPSKQRGEMKIGTALTVDLAHPVIADVRKGSPAANAGVERDAEILAVNNEKIHSWIDLLEALKKLRGEKISLTCRVGSTEKTYELGKLTPEVFRPEDYKWSLMNQVPFKPLMMTIVHRNPIRAIAWGAKETARMALSTYQSLAAIFRGSVDAKKQLSGPLGIGRLGIMSARRGLLKLVYLMAFLSTALAVFNFLPIPVLDGGHAMFIVIEKIRGKPLPLKLVNALQMIFLVLILGVFILITFNDAIRIWF